MRLRLGRNMALIGAILASLSLTVIAYSVNILLGIFISGLLIMAFGIVIMLDNKYKKQVTMEWEIGEIKQVNGEWYQCIKGYHCHDCSFYIDKRCTNACSLDGVCFDSSRSDNTEVIFKKLEKVGEPYVGNNGTFQSYKLAMPIYGDIPDQIIGFTTTEVVIKQNEEDMSNTETLWYGPDKKEAKSLKLSDLKPFSLEAAKAGKPVCTRDGRKARIICFDKKEGAPIVALVEVEKNERVLEEITLYYINGRAISKDIESKDDLMMLPEKKEGWINVYALNTCYSSKADAEAHIDGDYEHEYVRTVKIEWEE